jgi:tetratricopeptide (TPR) repeat protein
MLFNFQQDFRFPIGHHLAVLLLLLLVSLSVHAQTKWLAPERTLGQEISPNQKLLYALKVEKGQCYRIAIKQQPGVDLILSLFDAEHRKLVTVGGYRGFLKMDGLFPLQAWLDIVSLSFVAEVSGIYEVQVDAKDTQIAGHYEIGISDFHRAANDDLRRMDAEEEFERGERLRAPAHRVADLQQSIKHYEGALKIYRELGDKAGEAQTLDAIGLTHKTLQDIDKALDYCERALQLWQTLGDQRAVALGLYHLASVHTEQHKDAQALTELERSLQILRALGERMYEARVLGSYAAVSAKLPDDAESQLKVIGLFRQSVSLFHGLGDGSDEAFSLCTLSAYFTHISEDKQALATSRQALALLQPLGYKRYISFTLLRIGEIFYAHGDYQPAFDNYSEALAYSRNTGSYYEAYSLYNLGTAALALGDKKALEYLNRALPLWEGNRNGEAYTLAGIGRFYFSESKKQEALDYYRRALPMMRVTGDNFGVGIILSDIGAAYAAMNDRDKSVAYFRQALELHRAARDRRDEGRTLIRLGDIYESLGDVENAISHYQNSLEIFRAIGNLSGEGDAQFALAKAEAARGDLFAARAHIEEALRIVETARAGILGQDLR